jgi:hypothetical protein
LVDGIYSTVYADGIGLVGDVVYVGTTTGNVSATVPTTAGSIVKGVGQCIANNGAYYTINFRPDTTYFTNG